MENKEKIEVVVWSMFSASAGVRAVVYDHNDGIGEYRILDHNNMILLRQKVEVRYGMYEGTTAELNTLWTHMLYRFIAANNLGASR
jgi:hypothetical protein